MYDPSIARFLQEDTYYGDTADPLSLNLYSYVSNKPIKYYDPTGHWQQGDENLSQKEQQQLIDLTNQYFEAENQEDRDAIHALANDIRTNSKKTSESRTILSAAYDKVLEGTGNRVDSEGTVYVNKSEWDTVVRVNDVVSLLPIRKEDAISRIDNVSITSPSAEDTNNPLPGNGGKSSDELTVEDITELAITNIRDVIDNRLTEYKIIASFWDEPGLYHALLEGTVADIYYDQIEGYAMGIGGIDNIFGILDTAWDGVLSYKEAFEVSGGEPTLTAVLTPLLFIKSKMELDFGPSPSHIAEFFGWKEKKAKKLIIAYRKFQYIEYSSYRYLLDPMLWGYRDAFEKDLIEIQQSIGKEAVSLYDNDNYNEIYKNTQLNYVKSIINMNNNAGSSYKQLQSELDELEKYIKISPSEVNSILDSNK